MHWRTGLAFEPSRKGPCVGLRPMCSTACGGCSTAAARCLKRRLSSTRAPPRSRQPGGVLQQGAGAGLQGRLHQAVGAAEAGSQQRLAGGGQQALLKVKALRPHLAAHPACPPPPLPARVEQLRLPVESEELRAVHEAARTDALAKFERERFGGQLAALREGLEAAIAREHRCRGRHGGVLTSAASAGGSRQGVLHHPPPCFACLCLP